MSNRYGLAIRSADAVDAEGLAELIQTVGESVDPRALARRLEDIPAQSGLVLLAVDWGPPSGVIALNWSWTLFDELKVAQVTALIVDPQQRRKGIGRLLLKAASQAARSAGCGEIRLTAPMKADHLREFCLATGFDQAGDTFNRPLRKRS